MKKRIWQACLLFILMLVASLSLAQETSHELTITQVDSSNFPQINVWVSVVDSAGNPVTNLNTQSFNLLENGQPVAIDEVSQSRTEGTGGLNVILAIDRSGSMNEAGKLEAAQAAAIAFIERMRPEDKTAILVFNTEVTLLQPLSSDKGALTQAINSIEALDNTAMYDGISNSMDILSNVEGRRVIIVLSDGLDNASQNNAESILSRVESSELSIYTIGLGDSSLGTNSRAGIDEANLQRIAEQSRGVYAYAPDSQSLSDLYENLSYQLQNEYRLTYQTSNTVRDGVGRSLEIQILNQGAGQTIYNPGGLIPQTAESLAWPLFGGLFLVLLLLLALPRLLSRVQPAATTTKSTVKGRVKLTGNAKSQKQAATMPSKKL